MFQNVGSKIRIIAVIAFILCAIANIFVAVWTCKVCDSALDADFLLLLVLFLMISVVGIVVSWVVSLFIFGFGVLIESAEVMSDIAVTVYEKNQQEAPESDPYREFTEYSTEENETQ